jgi:hypothetical protein
VKNVTISLPDAVYKKARIKAAERETSLSGFVRDLLTSATLAEELESAARGRKQRITAILDEIHRSQEARASTSTLPAGEAASRRMTAKRFIDTNTPLYAVSGRHAGRAKSEIAREILRSEDICTSA